MPVVVFAYMRLIPLPVMLRLPLLKTFGESVVVGWLKSTRWSWVSAIMRICLGLAVIMS